MTPIERVAAFVQSAALARMPAARLERVKRHVIDTWAAQIAGSQIEAGRAVADLAGKNCRIDDVAVRCAQARCTEIDDIHLASCTTPGSVVVPTALALASGRDRPDGPIRVRDFCAAVLAGYECLIRVGLAIGGPAALHAGTWPTAFAAAVGSAATASRLLGLTVEQTADALAMSLVFAQDRAVSSSHPRSARWLTLGAAAASGVTGAEAARCGFVARLERSVILNRLTRGLGRQFVFDAVGMKPYPTARQGLAAIEASRELLGTLRRPPDEIDRIDVELPEGQQLIVDRDAFPRSRLESLVDVRYQIALALAAPERLYDCNRTPPFESSAVRGLMAKIRVRRARDLERHYPRCWPARVEVRARGARKRRVLLFPRGDAGNPLSAHDLAAKLRGLAAPVIGADGVERVLDGWLNADPDGPMPAFP